jgi:hypothetical protein
MVNPKRYSVRRQGTCTLLRRGCRRVLITLAGVTCVVVIAACGSSSKPGESARNDAFLAYSECMRSHGVPNFPDPSSGGGIHLSSGTNAQAPAFKSAQQACTKLLPGSGPGSQHLSEQDKIQMLEISQCMRRHGVAGFPDPTLSAPSSPAGYSLLEDRGGVVLAIPNTINLGSPAFKQAAAACGFH